MTFHCFALTLFGLGHVCTLTKQVSFGYDGIRTPGIRLLSKMDKHLLLDLVLIANDVVFQMAFSEFDYSFVVSTGFIVIVQMIIRPVTVSVQ